MKINVLWAFIFLTACATLPTQENMQQAFINEMMQRHGFDKSTLEQLFEQVSFKEDILQKIAKPAEAKPWHSYRAIFLTQNRIEKGVQFWRDNAQTLAEVEKRYGVPAEIITAIIGVETLYGKHKGSYRVIDALATLTFQYPPRSAFFRSELEQFLLLCRDEQMNPLQPVGSYAGAMGMPQFMPSSFQKYSADFDGDNRRDIWTNSADVIASVANYFVQHGWQKGQPIAIPAYAHDEQYQKVLTTNLKPHITLHELARLNVTFDNQFPNTTVVKLLEFEQVDKKELWLGFDNFYVITRYNHSALYAMAVYQLSQRIAEEFNQSHHIEK